MSEAVPSEKPEPHPFVKFTQFARRIVNVPKAEADKKEKEWREERAKTKKQRETRR